MAPGGSYGHGKPAGSGPRGVCEGLAALLPVGEPGWAALGRNGLGEAPTRPQQRPSPGPGATRGWRSCALAPETRKLSPSLLPQPLGGEGGFAGPVGQRAARALKTSRAWRLAVPAEGTVIALGCKERLVQLNKGKDLNYRSLLKSCSLQIAI